LNESQFSPTGFGPVFLEGSPGTEGYLNNDFRFGPVGESHPHCRQFSQLDHSSALAASHNGLIGVVDVDLGSKFSGDHFDTYIVYSAIFNIRDANHRPPSWRSNASD